jgi:glycine dehydrogenase subunit 1
VSYQPHVADDRRIMLDRLGVSAVDDLFADIPEALREPPLDVPAGLAEPELWRLLSARAGANRAHELVCFLGAGAYDHYIPAAVDELAGRGEFYTGYTPYQPEMTQGVLQAIFEYQTMICELTGMEVSNASLYDGATGLWEALLMAEREAHKGRFLLAASMHPRWRAAVGSYACAAEYGLELVPDDADGRLDLAALERALAAGASALAVALPTFFGVVQDYRAAADLCHRHGAWLIVAANPLALALLTTPAAMGADICVGDGQPLGVPLQFGGPYFGFLACRERAVRKMPGRIVGATVDSEGKRGFVLTLQAREQHIRREKATSNVCTNQALMALRATIYGTLLGREGLRDVARVCVRHTDWLRQQVLAIPGARPLYPGPHFHEFGVRLPQARARWQRALDAGYLAGLPLGDGDPALEDALLLCATERRTRAELEGLCAVLAEEVRV